MDALLLMYVHVYHKSKPIPSSPGMRSVT